MSQSNTYSEGKQKESNFSSN